MILAVQSKMILSHIKFFRWCLKMFQLDIYEQIALSEKQVIDESAKFDMLLKVKRGSKEEKFKVEVHKNNEGSFHLNQMQPHES